MEPAQDDLSNPWKVVMATSNIQTAGYTYRDHDEHRQLKAGDPLVAGRVYSAHSS